MFGLLARPAGWTRLDDYELLGMEFVGAHSSEDETWVEVRLLSGPVVRVEYTYSCPAAWVFEFPLLGHFELAQCDQAMLGGVVGGLEAVLGSLFGDWSGSGVFCC